MAKAKVLRKDRNWKPNPQSFSAQSKKVKLKGWKFDKRDPAFMDLNGNPVPLPTTFVECIWTGVAGGTGSWSCGTCPSGHTPVPADDGEDMPEGLVILVEC